MESETRVQVTTVGLPLKTNMLSTRDPSLLPDIDSQREETEHGRHLNSLCCSTCEWNWNLPDILKSTFVLAVNDLEKSKQFYVDSLGFTEDVSVEGWSFLSRGACHLRLGGCPGIRPMTDTPDHSWFAYLHVVDAESLYNEFVAKRVTVWHKIGDQPWGMREFAIVTPDGHRIVFGQTLS